MIQRKQSCNDVASEGGANKEMKTSNDHGEEKLNETQLRRKYI